MSVIPSYRTVVIGIRNPQERVIYPLSWHDLKQLQHIIGSIVAGCVNLADSGYTQEQLYQYVLTKISEIEKTPIRKSISSEQELTYVEKFEKAKSEGKTVVSKLFQKGIVSNHIYNMYVESNDELEKSELGEVITEFESSGYLRPEVQKKLSEKYKIEIV